MESYSGWFSISYGWFAIRNKGWSTESVQTEAKVFPDPTLMDPIIQWNCRCLNINFTVQAFLSIAGVSTILARYDILHSCVNLKTSAVSCMLKNIADQRIIMRHSAFWGSKKTNDKENILENFSPSRDCVSLTTVLIHTCICILGMCLIQLLNLLLLIHLYF